MPRRAALRGYPKAMSERLPPEALRRFLGHLRSVRDDAGRVHWIWSRHKDKDGYGQFKYAGRAWWAHRLSYATFRGPIPEGMTVNHVASCLRPGCVHPDCLELLTVGENAADANRRRGGQQQGSDEPIPE